MTSQKQIQIFNIILIISLALTLVACGGTQVQQAAPPVEVSIRLPWVHKADFAGYYLAQQEGYYQQQNLTVKVQPIDFEEDVISKVLSGKDQFGEAPGISLLQARAEGKPLVAVAMITRRNPDIFLALAESNITKGEDLVGKRVGITAAQEYALQLLLSLAKLAPSQIEKVTLTEYTPRPLFEGEVDVLAGYATDQPVTAKLQGIELNIISNDDYGVHIPGHVIFTTEEMVKNNPDLVKRFVQATLKGFETVMKTPEQGVRATLRVDETLNDQFEAGALEALQPYMQPDDKPLGYMDQAVWQQGVEMMTEQGLLSAPLDVNAVFTTQFLEQ